jgi:hypothetical protein
MISYLSAGSSSGVRHVRQAATRQQQRSVGGKQSAGAGADCCGDVWYSRLVGGRRIQGWVKCFGLWVDAAAVLLICAVAAAAASARGGGTHTPRHTAQVAASAPVLRQLAWGPRPVNEQQRQCNLDLLQQGVFVFEELHLVV